MLEDLFAISWTSAGLIALSATGIYLTVITYTKIAGLRSFSKMASFDFVTTVAIGSLVGSVTLTRASLAEGMFALALLYLLQVIVAMLRRHAKLKYVIGNKPLLLMAHGQFLADNLNKARITKRDVYAQLRMENVHDPDAVRAVILEQTGDISILYGEEKIVPALLDDVRDGDKVTNLRQY